MPRLTHTGRCRGASDLARDKADRLQHMITAPVLSSTDSSNAHNAASDVLMACRHASSTAPPRRAPLTTITTDASIIPPPRGDASSSTITTHSWHSSAVVVPAIFREWGSTLPLSPPPWLTAQYPVYLYQRLNSSFPCFCLNRGYESGIILQFLVDHYTRLPAIVAFVQADWLQRARGVMGLPAPFDFWQPQCALERIDAPWHSWMPLGKRHSCWPPGHMWRNAMYWEHARSQHTHGAPSVSAALVDACWHALLGIFGQSLLSPLVRLNLTFYPYQNFVASRGQLRQHGHERYKLAHEGS